MHTSICALTYSCEGSKACGRGWVQGRSTHTHNMYAVHTHIRMHTPFRCEGAKADEVVAKSKAGHFQLACALAFEAIHHAPHEIGINRPSGTGCVRVGRGGPNRVKALCQLPKDCARSYRSSSCTHTLTHADYYIESRRVYEEREGGPQPQGQQGQAGQPGPPGQAAKQPEGGPEPMQQ